MSYAWFSNLLRFTENCETLFDFIVVSNPDLNEFLEVGVNPLLLTQISPYFWWIKLPILSNAEFDFLPKEIFVHINEVCST